MRQLLTKVVRALVESPDSVQIEEEIQEDTIVFHITVNHYDVGNLIGENGEVARALHTLIKSLASKQGQRIQLAEAWS